MSDFEVQKPPAPPGSSENKHLTSDEGEFFFPLHNSNEQRRTGAGEDLKMQIKGIGVWL